MSIVIENPTAESIAPLQDGPAEELSRLSQMLSQPREESIAEEEEEWRRIAAHSAARFDEEESA